MVGCGCLFEFFCWEQKGGRFCWSVKIGMIHVTTCKPADREWRSLNELNINQVNVNCEEGQEMAALSMITVVLHIFDSFHFCRIRTRHQQIRPRTDLWVFVDWDIFLAIFGLFKRSFPLDLCGFWDVFSPQKQLRSGSLSLKAMPHHPLSSPLRSQEIVKGIIFFFLGGMLSMYNISTSM